MSAKVVLVTNTIMDGQVVRWYASEAFCELGDELISASRVGVLGGRSGYLTPELFAEAWSAHTRLKAREYVPDLATHTRQIFGPLVRRTS